jgi:cellulose synthase/poly-beta-1,6-N-acetylglucosamine synthase-like glycosyltransferase
MIKKAEDIRYELEKALNIMKSDRPGPVHLDIPIDVSKSLVETDDLIPYDVDLDKSYDIRKIESQVDKFLKDLKISIIIPSFNQGQFIEATIVSVLGQSYKNFEIIIIDGGSADNTVEIIKKYESHIRYWISEKDKGQSDAINKGLKISSGHIVTWLNSDDYYESNALEIIANIFITEPNVDLVHGKSRLFGENVKSQIVGLKQDLLLQEYLAYMRFPQPSSFFKKK